jgi:hypothetical protein
MWEKLTTALLTKWLTDANIKLSLPVMFSIFITVISWLTIRVGKMEQAQQETKSEVYNQGAVISTQISKNNELMFEIGQEVLGTWVDRIAGSQKMLLDYIEVSDREKRRMIENIDAGREEVIGKAARLKKDYMIRRPDSLGIAVQKLKNKP